jgi:hypothetical protein
VELVKVFFKFYREFCVKLADCTSPGMGKRHVTSVQERTPKPFVSLTVYLISHKWMSY